MAQEIERKFLVSDDFKKEVYNSFRIVQGFLSSVAERTVRVRIKGEKGFITVKGIPNQSGTSRFEWEKEISISEAESLLELCEPGLIDKIRHLVKSGSHIFEIDEFEGDNKGLVIAEIEMENENDFFDKPEWLGAEVTGDVKYYNSNLIKKPFCTW